MTSLLYVLSSVCHKTVIQKLIIGCDYARSLDRMNENFFELVFIDSRVEQASKFCNLFFEEDSMLKKTICPPLL